MNAEMEGFLERLAKELRTYEALAEQEMEESSTIQGNDFERCAGVAAFGASTVIFRGLASSIEDALHPNQDTKAEE